MVQTSLLKYSKTQLLTDCRKGIVEFRMKSDAPYSSQPWYCKVYRKPTRVKTYEIYFDRSRLLLPKNSKLIEYTDDTLTIYDDQGHVQLTYDIRRKQKERQ